MPPNGLPITNSPVASGAAVPVAAGDFPAASMGPRGVPWGSVRERLRSGGLRWTRQRRALLAVLAETDGHVTGAELVERCRQRDPATIPSTVYRTLDLLEQVGIVRHGHGPNGREEYHVLPEDEHGHVYCHACGSSWELGREEAAGIVAALEAERGFEVDLSHVTIVGRCRECRPGG